MGSDSTPPTYKNAKLSWRQRVQFLKRHPLPLPDRGRGVIRAIIDILKRAGADPTSPVAKLAILAKLKRKFPTASEKKMLTTINNQVPNQILRYRGIYVWRQRILSGKYKGKYGYWIEGEGKEPQPR